MPVVVMILATLLGAGALTMAGHETPAVAALVILGVIGLGLVFWARSQGAAELERLRASAASRDQRLTGIQAETERMRLDLQRALGQQRDSEERARAAEAVADRQKQSEMALRESRAEVERLRKDLEAARRPPTAAPAATSAPPAATPSAPAPARAPGPAATAAPASPPRPAPASPAAPPLRPAAPPPRPAPASAPPAPPRPVPAPTPAPAAPAAPAPVIAAPVADVPAPAPLGKREPDPAPGTALGTLLLVDDDPSFLFVAANILRPAGFHVLEAESGQAALDRAGQHTGKIDLLVTDMMMPGMNGRHLAQRFTKLRPGVRVLYISGIVDEGSAREAIEGEEADFLGKPFEADTFTAKVRELLRAGSRGG
jgi:CheY-like chemotaxis protein/Skp family chaperone for outer membrane proteins